MEPPDEEKATETNKKSKLPFPPTLLLLSEQQSTMFLPFICLLLPHRPLRPPFHFLKLPVFFSFCVFLTLAMRRVLLHL
jgi:hypothetical protein